MKRSFFVPAALFVVAGCGEEPARDFREVLQEVRVCAAGATVDGIDVSYWQGTIDWDRVASAGVRFAIVRTGDGYFEDPQFERNWSEARRVGLFRGAYHYFRPDKSPEDQADIMVRKLGRLGPGDLPPVIDLENESLYTGYTLSQKIDKVQRFLDRVEAGTGRQVMIYAGKYFWQDAFNSTAAFVDHPLWIPQYGPTCPDIPAPWTQWLFFQTSSHGRVSGISGNVDLDLFNGDEAALEAVANGSVPGDGGGGGQRGKLQGVVFEDIGLGTSDMSHRLPGATVSLSSGGSTSASAEEAYWAFDLPAGTYTVTASMAGYLTASRTCTVNAGAETWCSVGLVAAGGGDDEGGGGGDGEVGGGGSGGDDGGSGGGDGAGGGDTTEGKGRIWGRVVDAETVVDPQDAASAEPVPSATVLVDGEFTVVADGNGYFEAWVTPGEITLLASAPDYEQSGNDCIVTEGGSVECNIFLPPKTNGQESADDQETLDQYGCSCGHPSPSPAGLALLLGLGSLRATRKKRPKR